MTRTDANKQIVEQFITALFTDGDLTAVDRYLDPGFINQDPPFPGTPARCGRHATDWRDVPPGFPGLAQRPAAADRRGRPGGGELHRPRHPPRHLTGEAPTGREVILRGVNIFRVADGKITERWGRLNHLGLLQQLGLAPQPSAAATA